MFSTICRIIYLDAEISDTLTLLCYRIDKLYMLDLCISLGWMLTGEYCDLFGFLSGLNLLLCGYVPQSPGGLVLSVGYKTNK
jgi:hypothetical protein